MLIIHIYRTNFPDNFNVLQSKMSESGCGGRNTDTWIVDTFNHHHKFNAQI